MADKSVTREEAQQAFETLCKYVQQHKQADEVLCLFISEDYDLDENRFFITLHNVKRDFEMRYYVDDVADGNVPVGWCGRSPEKGGDDMGKLLRGKLEKLADPTYPRRLEEFQRKINPKPPKEEIEAELQRRRLHIEALMTGKVTETTEEVNK